MGKPGPKPQPRLPAEPLLVMWDRNMSMMARSLGVSRRAVQHWNEIGLSWRQADEVAGKLGLHPFDIWGSAWFELESKEPV